MDSVKNVGFDIPPRVIRVDRRVRRNEPCPCGSGKKFKRCHMPKSGTRVPLQDKGSS